VSDQQAITRRQDSPAMKLNQFLSAKTTNLATYAKNSIKPATLIRLAVFEFSQNEWLQRCSPESVYAALITAAQLGLEPSGSRGLGYLVPYNGKCTFQPGWRGLIALALRSKAVKSIYAHVVREGDDFSVQLGTAPKIHHVPSISGGEEREVIAAYAVAVLADGAMDMEVMDLWELERIRKSVAASRGGKDSPAYAQWADQMYRKAPIRRLCKRLPLGDDYFAAAHLDEQIESGKTDVHFDGFIDIQDSEPTENVSKIQAAASRRQSMPAIDADTK